MKRIFFKTSKGKISILHFPCYNKTSPVIHWAHANGFNALTYKKLLTNLSKYFHVYAWDACGHGKTNLQVNLKKNFYDTCSEDLKNILTFIHEKHQKKIICAGHSFGGTLSLIASSKNPSIISKILLADPVIFTHKIRYLSKIARFLKLKNPKNIYLSKNALNRKYIWDSEEEIINSYKNKSFFENWEINCIKNYISDGIIKNNNEIKLSCSPKLESKIFKESEDLNLYKLIKKISLPTYLYLSDNNSPTFAKTIFEKNKNVKLVFTLKKTDHFFPITKSNIFIKKILNDF